MSQTIISLNSGQEFFLTEAELLATIPSQTGHVAKALDTKKVWIFKSIVTQQNITVSPVSGASANTYPENPSAISPGEDRAYFRINVQNIESMTVSGARTDVNWTWVFRDADLAPVLFSTFKGNGTVLVPPGSVWAYRTYKTSAGEEYSKMSIVAAVRTGESAWEDSGLSELDLSKSYTDKRIHEELYVNRSVNITVSPVSGASANTYPENPSAIAPGKDRAYFRINVQNIESMTVSGARTDVNWTWVFRDADLAPVLFSTFKGNGTVLVPPGSVWAYRTYKTSAGEEYSKMSIVAERLDKRLDDIINDISDLSSMISKLEFDMSPDGSRISPNDFEGDTQDERIRNALAYIKRRGWGVLDLGIDTVSPVQTSTWTISSALLIPSNCWLYLNHSKLKLANGVFDNIIRNDGIVPSSDPFLVATALNENVNIRIFGTGTDSAFIEGPDVPYTAPHPINGGTAIPWVGDFYGWRTIPILLANVKNYKVHDFHISKTTCWAISQEHGCDNFEVFNIDFNTTVKNGDGIDVRMGCKNGRIYGISGITLDDTIALSALRKDGRVYPDGNYIYPMQVGGYADRGFGTDIEDVRIWNVKGCGDHNGVRLLNSGGSKLKNIAVDDVADSGGSYGGSVVRVSSGYGVASVMGDTVGISINKVTSTYSNTPITLDGPIQDSQVNAIYQANASGVLIKNTATLQDTTVTNIKRV
ncbi:glycoside hydrolase family protein [Providencia sp. Me31A]|uniref:hypothetical protein n=1 Tax=Providencia sp. Me31A TaxID=3392637 RepID=UPI003D290C05